MRIWKLCSITFCSEDTLRRRKKLKLKKQKPVKRKHESDAFIYSLAYDYFLAELFIVPNHFEARKSKEISVVGSTTTSSIVMRAAKAQISVTSFRFDKKG